MKYLKHIKFIRFFIKVSIMFHSNNFLLTHWGVTACTLVKSSQPSWITNLMEFIGALSVMVTDSFCIPEFLYGSSLLSPILTKVLLVACLQPSMRILRAIKTNYTKRFTYLPSFKI
jgi:hypothetical protein